jgi:hypothetical protein
MSSSNTGLVYSGGTQTSGPFSGQVANVEGWFPDQLKASFVCTQSALNAQGKITVGLYYTYPNNSLNFSAGVNTYNATLSAITTP